ncbi:hypothetical protein LC607_01280 [Nostoc sp. CHAB 5824]|nr:hypothetical protein [Nostoc sp. CHAB 5824]
MAKILNSLQLGSERIRNLSNSLRSFCRSDNKVKIFTDLHQGLDSTLMILQHRLKANGARPGIEVIKTYGVLPEVNYYIGQMN